METKRLIDANAFRDSIKSWKISKIPKGELLWDLDHQPTVDAVEVVHGYNTGKARWFQCSVCGYGFDDIFLLDESDDMMEPKYCAHCGAKMDGDKNGESN